MLNSAVVESDSGCFVLSTQPSTDPLLDLPKQGTAEAAVIAGLVDFDDQIGWVLVQTATQMGPVHVQVEFGAHAAAPDKSWEDVVEFSFTSTGPVVVDELFGEALVLTLCPQAGSYRVQVSARGQDAGRKRERAGIPVDENGEPVFAAEAVESILLQAWPAPPSPAVAHRITSAAARERQQDAEPLDEDQRRLHDLADIIDLPDVDAVIRAAQEIGSILDQRPTPLGQLADTGTLDVAYLVVGKPRRLFDRLLEGLAPPSCVGFTNPDWPYNEGRACSQPDDHPHHHWYGRFGEVRCVWLETTRPSIIVKSWDWHQPPTITQELAYSMADVVRLDIAPTHVRIELQTSTFDGRPAVEIHLSHDKLPQIWIKPMTVLWRSAFDGLRLDGHHLRP